MVSVFFFCGAGGPSRMPGWMAQQPRWAGVWVALLLLDLGLRCCFLILLICGSQAV